MEPHEGLPETGSAGSRPAGPDVGHAATGVETSAVRPPDEGRAARMTFALLAAAAVILLGAAVLTGPGRFGAGGADDGGVAGAPPAGPVGPAALPGAPGVASTATGRTPGASPEATTAAPRPSVTPYLVWPTPTPTPARTPPPDVPVIDRGTTPLVPSRIVVVGGASAPDDWPSLAADSHGVLWAAGSAGLLRYEPATQRRTTWTVADDAAFGTPGSIATSRAGGIWLAEQNSPTLRRFDGTRFVEVIDAPGRVTALAEEPDGTLWVGTWTGLYRRVAGTWEGMAFASEQTTVSSLLVDSRGAVWAGWLQYPTPPGTGWITRWDGSGWQRFDGDGAVSLRLPVLAIREAPDGSVWAGTASGLALWDGTSWATLDQPLGSVTSIAWDADGATWIAAGDSSDGTVRVAHETADGWVAYGPDQGLPDANESGTIVASVAPTAHGIFVGTGAGIRTLEDGRWERVGSAARATPPAPAWVRALFAVSRHEAWAIDDHTAWHAVDGAWTVPSPGPSVSGSDRMDDLLVDRQGRVWVATSAGVFVLEDGTWTKADRRPAAALALGPDGRVWAAGEDAAMGPQQVRAFRRLGGVWVAEPLPATALVTWARCLAVDRDGTVWLGSFGDWGIRPGLLRYTTTRGWENVPVRGSTPDEYIWDLAVSADGVAWVIGSDVVPQGTPTSDEPTAPRPWWIARLTGGPSPAAVGERGWPPYHVALVPDGTPVMPMPGSGLATWDGHEWSARYGGLAFDQVSVAPDGTVWVTAGGGVWVLP